MTSDERKSRDAELAAASVRTTLVEDGPAGVANLDAKRKQKREEGEQAALHRVLVDEQLIHAHEMPTPFNAPPHIRRALAAIRSMTPEERAVAMAPHVMAVPESTRGHFALDEPKALLAAVPDSEVLS